jgi:TorA maturation chaperone TorD
MAVDESIRILLAGRAGAYRIFQNLLGNEPTTGMLEQLLSPASQEVLGLFAVDDGEYQSALDGLFLETNHYLYGTDNSTSQIEDNFTRLFVGPGKVEVSPWESMYTTNETVLFQPATLEVRKAYVASGFIPQAYPHVADDHIALELDFMAQLAAKLSERYESGDVETALLVLGSSYGFLNSHLLLFAANFAAALSRAKHGFWYRKVGRALAVFLTIDAQALGEIEFNLSKE